MFSTVEWMVAVRYLRARRQHGFVSVIAGLSLLGIALGVATLIIVLSVMNGFRAELLDRILGLNGHIVIQGVSAPLDDFDEISHGIQLLDNVVRVSPLIEGQVMATSRINATGALVRGVRQTDLLENSLIADNVVQGSLDNYGDGKGIVVGERLANKHEVLIGDHLTLISAQGTATAFGTVPRARAYKVVATFDVGMFEYDSSLIFMPLSDAQVYFRLSDAVSALEVMIKDPNQVEEISSTIIGELDNRVRISNWQQINSHFFNALKVERNVMFLILALIIIVAAFNIISSLIMLVKDKASDIAILRSMGASRAMIMRIFFILGASIGVVGTILGFALGVGFADNIDLLRHWLEGLTGTELFSAEIYFLSHLPAKIDFREVVSVVIMALLLSFLATIYPAWRAGRLEPVEALRRGG